MRVEKDILKDQQTTSDATKTNAIKAERAGPSHEAETSAGPSSSLTSDATTEEGTRLPITVTPPRGSELEETWEQSPLDIAIRRRLFFRSKSRKSITSEVAGKRKLSPAEVQSRASTLRQSTSLDGANSEDGQHEAKTEPGSPTSTKVDGRFSSQHPRTPITKAKENFAQFETEKLEQEDPDIPEPSSEAQPPGNFICPRVGAPDPRRTLNYLNLFMQRVAFGSIVLAMNIACLVAALKSQRHVWVLIIILIVKAKDVLSTVIQLVWVATSCFRTRDKEHPKIAGKWILACITAYDEPEETMMRTINSVVDNAPPQHNMAVVIIFDGKPQKVLRQFTKVNQVIHRPYRTWKYAHNELNIYAGSIKGVPTIMFEKIGNAGKKDSLILCHDLFDEMRDNVPDPTKELRAEVWTELLPQLITTTMPQKFDFLFFIDVDSVIQEDTMTHLSQALANEPNSIAACGLVLVDMMPGKSWSMWYLYQQFQYTFGQFVRRRAEGIWGRVTCLPGCVTMIKNRPEMAGAIKLYANPITDKLVFQHQVQYLGTDRRITWCMLEQSQRLRTLFIPEAISHTAAPENLRHYMSQRRRWGSNAYFNDILYIFGYNSWLITRLWALIDVLRQTLVYYRLANTIMFIYGLSRHFLAIKLVPYIVVTQLPAVWFCLLILHEPILRKQAHKLFAGWIINKFISPIFAIMIFSRVLVNLGDMTWGRKGVSSHAKSALDILHALTPKRSWTPAHITTLVRDTIRERTQKTRKTKTESVAPKYKGQQRPPDSTPSNRDNATSWTSSSLPASPMPAHIRSAGKRGSSNHQEE